MGKMLWDSIAVARLGAGREEGACKSQYARAQRSLKGPYGPTDLPLVTQQVIA